MTNYLWLCEKKRKNNLKPREDKDKIFFQIIFANKRVLLSSNRPLIEKYKKKLNLLYFLSFICIYVDIDHEKGFMNNNYV